MSKGDSFKSRFVINTVALARCAICRMNSAVLTAFPSGNEAVETAWHLFYFIVHRAKAAVLMTNAAKQHSATIAPTP